MHTSFLLISKRPESLSLSFGNLVLHSLAVKMPVLMLKTHYFTSNIDSLCSLLQTKAECNQSCFLPATILVICLRILIFTVATVSSPGKNFQFSISQQTKTIHCLGTPLGFTIMVSQSSITDDGKQPLLDDSSLL